MNSVLQGEYYKGHEKKNTDNLIELIILLMKVILFKLTINYRIFKGCIIHYTLEIYEKELQHLY